VLGMRSLPPFPGKKLLGKPDVIAEERRPQLERYLQCIVQHVVSQSNSPLLTPDVKETLIRLIPLLGPNFDTTVHPHERERRGTLSKAAGGFWTKS